MDTSTPEVAMRLATVELDGWTLRSAEESAAASADTFWIPSAAARRSLRRGSAAKLIFDIRDDQGELHGERMWVTVSERVGDLYVGVLGNQPACLRADSDGDLCKGAEIAFGPEHVADIGEPPDTFVQSELGTILTEPSGWNW